MKQRIYLDASVLERHSKNNSLTVKAEKKDEKKDFDTVQTFRKIKDKISKDLKGLSFDQIKEYLKTQSSKLQAE